MKVGILHSQPPNIISMPGIWTHKNHAKEKLYVGCGVKKGTII